MRELKTYTPRERNMYLTAMFGQNMLYGAIGVFTNYFAKDVLFIPAMTVGVIMTVAQVWAAASDPIMGTIVDRTRSKLGKCRPWLVVTPGVIFVLLMLCFLCGIYQYGPEASAWRNAGVVVWAGGLYILCTTAYTLGDIPLWGITALMTEDEKHRQKIQAAARITGGIGQGISTALFQPIALFLSQKAQSDRQGFLLTALIFAVFGFITFQMGGVFVKEKIVPQNRGSGLAGNFKMLWKNKPFRQILISGILGSPRSLLGMVVFPLVTYYYASKDPGKALFYIALFGIATAIGQFPVQGLTPKLLERFPKRRLYILSNLIEVPANILLFLLFLGSGGLPGGLTHPAMLAIVFLCFVVKSAAAGLFLVLQANMIADAVDYEDYTNHVRPEGVFFSGLTFMTKVSNGISNLIYQSLSALVGLSGVNIMMLQNMIDNGGVPRELMRRGSGAIVHSMAQGALTSGQLYSFFAMMFFAVSILPAISNVLAVLPMRKYALTDEKYSEILEVLQARRRVEGELAED